MMGEGRERKEQVQRTATREQRSEERVHVDRDASSSKVLDSPQVSLRVQVQLRNVHHNWKHFADHHTKKAKIYGSLRSP
jgi:hypothetical protein